MLEIVIFVVIVLALAGAGYWLQTGTQSEIEQRRLAQDWPKTTGTVSEAGVAETKGFKMRIYHQPFRQRIRLFRPQIHYSYRVAGQDYQSSKYQNNYLSAGSEWATIFPKKAQKIADQYPPGQPATVRYNPQQPDQAYLVLDTSITRPLITRMIGYMLIAAAALIVILEARAIGQDYLARRAASDNPAVITAPAAQIKTELEKRHGLVCEFDPKLMRGAYQNWTCQAPATTALFYVRQDAPEKVDLIAMSVKQDKAAAFFTEVVQMALPEVDPRAAQDWIAQTAATLSEGNNEAETTINGVPFNLSLTWDNGLSLKIGGLKDF